ncbi:MAG: hypothetical protein H5U04_07415 [Firmicutes bacterium]|nr:hypothetical protein [Bacillota bacterium]
MPRDVRFAVLSAHLPKELELALNTHIQSEKAQGREFVHVQVVGRAGDLVALVVTGKSEQHRCGGC